MLTFVGKQYDAFDSMSYHPAALHCLDVAATAKAYLDINTPLRLRLIKIITNQLPELSESEAINLCLFFIAVHDLGKFDARFQGKFEFLSVMLNPDFDINSVTTKGYDHGSAGYTFFNTEIEDYGFDINFLDVFYQTIIDVMGHHGQCKLDTQYESGALSHDKCDISIVEHNARVNFVNEMRDLFIPDLDFSFLDDYIEKIDEGYSLRTGLLAGLCCIADWIGSDTNFFKYTTECTSLSDYFHSIEHKANEAIKMSGLYKPTLRHGFDQLYPKFTPQSIQTCLEDIPPRNGLYIVEADAGAGKTEVAFSLASSLIKENHADSIIFALPSQATANAIMSRVEDAAERIFESSNVILAHGTSSFNEMFTNIKNRIYDETDQSSVQCSKWLAESRKRTMLAQIGVCTVDQVLMSTLPIRHQFVRGFGIKKSVLIIDEAHAYDAWMYSLILELLRDCSEAFSSVIIMSATLPAFQKKMLLGSYGYTQSISQNDDYPLITHFNTKHNISRYTPKDKPKHKQIKVHTIGTEQCEISDTVLKKIITKCEEGYRVAVIVNSVNTAQDLFIKLQKSLSPEQLKMFHSRYTYSDRHVIENNCIDLFGKGSRPRHGTRGLVLIATQVVEQSIDLDFDVMFTQICPIDLLCQRTGRLGRHELDNAIYRPYTWKGHELFVITPSKAKEYRYGAPPEASPYGVTAYIYQNARALRRTEHFISRNTTLHFPKHFRESVEYVYQVEPHKNEHPSLTSAYERYEAKYIKSYALAKSLAVHNSTPVDDTNESMKLMTRESDISASLLLIKEDKSKLMNGEPYLLANRKIAELSNKERESISLNSVSITKKMEKQIEDHFDEELDMYVLNFYFDSRSNTYKAGSFEYSSLLGLRLNEK